MPGPVSDSYDPEWSTSSNAEQIIEALDEVYKKVSGIVGNPTPLFILNLLAAKGMTKLHAGPLTIKEWRIIRFALERARDSI